MLNGDGHASATLPKRICRSKCSRRRQGAVANLVASAKLRHPIWSPSPTSWRRQHASACAVAECNLWINKPEIIILYNIIGFGSLPSQTFILPEDPNFRIRLFHPVNEDQIQFKSTPSHNHKYTNTMKPTTINIYNQKIVFNIHQYLAQYICNWTP